MESKLKRNINKFFSSRNGLDELALASLILSLIFTVLVAFLKDIIIFYVLSIIFFLYTLFRI